MLQAGFENKVMHASFRIGEVLNMASDVCGVFSQKEKRMSSSTINTKKVIGRRVVRYESFDELLADAERLAVVPTLLSQSVGPGFRLPKKSASLIPDPATTEEGPALLSRATDRIKQNDRRAPRNPAFGKCSRAYQNHPVEWTTQDQPRVLLAVFY